MIDAAEHMPSKISTGYSTPQIAIAVVIAIVLHGALVGATMLSSSGKGPEAAATSATGPVKPGAAPDANTKPISVTADPKDSAKPKPDEDAVAPDPKRSASEPKKGDTSLDSIDDIERAMK